DGHRHRRGRAALSRQVAACFGHAHRRGVPHRDPPPDRRAPRRERQGVGGGRARPRLPAHARGLRAGRGRAAGLGLPIRDVGHGVGEGGPRQVQAGRGSRQLRPGRHRRAGPSRPGRRRQRLPRQAGCRGDRGLRLDRREGHGDADGGRAPRDHRHHRRLRRHADRTGPRRLRRRGLHGRDHPLAPRHPHPRVRRAVPHGR
ncbi:MAG: hypothetical protein AVDCRST_MAG79-1538, partial [uncultured Thermoleophilia bacterium]